MEYAQHRQNSAIAVQISRLRADYHRFRDFPSGSTTPLSLHRSIQEAAPHAVHQRMPPRLPLTPSRVSHGFRACAPRPSSCSSSSSSAYGTGPLFDLLTPALKFRARHASAHALQQKVVEDPEDAYMSLGSGGRVVSGDGVNAEAGPSRWTQRAQVGKEGASAEMDLEEERAVTEISGMVFRSRAWSELSVKGKERSWMPTPPEQGVTATPSPSAQIHSTRFHRARRRPLYPSATASADSIISTSKPQELHSDDRAQPTLYGPSHPCPTTLIDRYRHNPSFRAYGELLARYARRLDNVKAEKDVRDIMGRARIAPASYIKGKRRMRPPIIRYEKPPDPEEVVVAEVEDADDLLELSADHALSTGDEEMAGSDATFEAGGEAGAADDAADPDSIEGQEGAPRVRKEYRTKRRRRKEQSTENIEKEGSLIKADGSLPTAAFKPDLPPHMNNLSADPPSIDLPTDPLPRHPRAPDRRRDPNSPVPNIRAIRAWPPRPLPVHPISAQQILQCLHHRLLHPRRYTRRISLSNALDLVRLVPPYRPSSLIDVLHLYLSYAHWPASEELRAEWDAYFRTDMSLFEYEQRDLAGMKGMMNAQTLHLCVLSVIRSRVARDRKSAALRSLLHGAQQASVSPGTETTRHLVRFCMAIDDKVWCKQLVHHWRDAHAYESNRIASSSINLGAPSTLLPPEFTVNQHDPNAYNSVPLRISRRGQTLQRWFRTLRRLERKGWIKRASTLDDAEGELLEEQQGQHWRGDYEWAEEPIEVDEGEGGREQ